MGPKSRHGRSVEHRDVTDRQPNLFSGAGIRWNAALPDTTRRLPLSAADLDDAALIAALPECGLADCRGVAAEAGRRRLVAAIPALEALCRRFKGFGIDHAIPEQTAAVQALAQLVYGLQEQKGFIVLTVEAGTATTTLLQPLLQKLDSNTAVAFVFNSTLPFEDILEYVLEDYGIGKAGSTPAQRLVALSHFLIERRRAQIIEAAYEVFSTKGYTSTGIADIAARLGMGHGTFYRYFKNKRDILDQVVDYGVERIMQALELETAAPAQTAAEFRDQLRRIGERLFELLDAEPGVGQVVLLEATSIDQEMNQRVLRLVDTFGALAGTFLQNGVRRGFLRTDLDTASVGRAVTALTLPGLFAAVRGEAGEAERKRYVDAMVSLVCDGIAAA